MMNLLNNNKEMSLNINLLRDALNTNSYKQSFGTYKKEDKNIRPSLLLDGTCFDIVAINIMYPAAKLFLMGI